MISNTRIFLKALILVVLLALSSSLLFSTSVWANQVVTNGRILNSGIAIDSAGNVAIIGSTVGFGNGYPALAALLKYSPSGKLACFKTFGVSNSLLDTFGYGVAFDSSNNMYVTGTTQTFGGQDFDVFLQKYDSSCNLASTFQWGGREIDVPRSITVDASDNVYITGYTDSFGAGLFDVFLLKFSPADNEFRFTKTWGGPQNDYGFGVTVDGFDNVYVTGGTNSYGAAQSDAFLLKYDSSGNLLYQKTWGGPQSDYGNGVAVDNVGDIYVAGTTNGFGTNPGVPNAFLLMYDPAGNLLSKQFWQGGQSAYGTGVTVDGAGNVCLTGYVYGLGANPEVPNSFLLKYDPAGNLLLQRTWGGNRGDYGYGIAVDAQGNIYVTGYTFSFGPNSQGVNIFFLKYAASGDLLFQKTYGGGIPDP
jgi:hypothetical protein